MQQDFVNRHFFSLTVFALVFGVMFYDIIDGAGFSYIDEICALFLFMLFALQVFRSKDWAFDRLFLIALGIFLFYLFYSLAIGSNTKRAIWMDFVIQIKPYLAFFCVFSLRPVLDASRKKIIRQTAIVFSVYLLMAGLTDMAFSNDIVVTLLSHPSRFATAASILALLYLYCSDYTKKDKIVFLLILSIGIFSGRSKLYGFLVMCTFMMLYVNRSFEMKLNFKNTILLMVLLAATFVVAREKITLYFITGGFGSGREAEDLYARMALYYFSIPVLTAYFPFGSGFASYATYASGAYYSRVYVKYHMEYMYGLTPDAPVFIADTYYPALAQFGIAGVCLFFFFWICLGVRAAGAFIRGYKKEAVIALMIIAFFLIECTSDATITHNRGFFMMMLLGLIFSDIRRKAPASGVA
jgi:hypothetical protein